MICENCNQQCKFYTEKSGKMFYRCTLKSCANVKVSIWHGTVFYNAKIPFHKIMLIFNLWLYETKIMKIVEMTKLSLKCIKRFIHLAESIIIADLDEEDELIGGEGIEVQIDESKFGKRKYNRGHQVNGVWILGGVELTEERKLFLKIVEGRSKRTLQEVIEKHVKKGSIIVADCWRSYNGLNELDYGHYRVNHSKSFIDETTGFHTNNIEGTWSAIKSKCSTYQKTAKRIQGKLFEFIWRRKHFKDIWTSFIFAMSEIHVENL